VGDFGGVEVCLDLGECALWWGGDAALAGCHVLSVLVGLVWFKRFGGGPVRGGLFWVSRGWLGCLFVLSVGFSLVLVVGVIVGVGGTEDAASRSLRITRRRSTWWGRTTAGRGSGGV
jgi:hypothetical protein